MLVKQLKNRYNDPTSSKRFVIGIDRAKMKLYDLEESAQDDLIDRMAENKTKKGKFNAHGKKMTMSHHSIKQLEENEIQKRI